MTRRVTVVATNGPATNVQLMKTHDTSDAAGASQVTATFDESTGVIWIELLITGTALRAQPRDPATR